MKSLQNLPEGYKEIFSVDLHKNKKLSLLINSLALLGFVVLAVLMHFYIPIYSILIGENFLKSYFLKMGIFLVLSTLYIILHELVHGITMKYYGTKKIKYGFNGVYAFAGSDDYYDKRSYITIALAPVVVWGIVLSVVLAFVPYDWFWVVYLLQIINITGAVGDFYVTAKFSRFPKDILVRDYGVGMVVYSKEEIK